MPEPNRPAVTPAQIGAALLAGIPIVANLLSVFGVYDLTTEQQDALISTMQWALGAAGILAFADAGLRAARNHAHATVAAAPRPRALTVDHSRASFDALTKSATGTWSSTPTAGDSDALPDVPTTPADQVPADQGDAGNTEETA